MQVELDATQLNLDRAQQQMATQRYRNTVSGNKKTEEQFNKVITNQDIQIQQLMKRRTENEVPVFVLQHMSLYKISILLFLF